jgi:hypothetical protein
LLEVASAVAARMAASPATTTLKALRESADMVSRATDLLRNCERNSSDLRLLAGRFAEIVQRVVVRRLEALTPHLPGETWREALAAFTAALDQDFDAACLEAGLTGAAEAQAVEGER